MESRKQEIICSLNKISDAIKKHRELSQWGNVESKQRLRELRSRKRELINELNNMK